MEAGRSTEDSSRSLSPSRRLRVILRRRRRRQREGNLAAALTQSMALAVVGTAGAYPSWVLVSGAEKVQIVLGASWAINKAGPASGSVLLGPDGPRLMMAIALCCIFSVFIGSFALTLDFLGWRRWRRWAPLFHGFATLLIACATGLGLCLLEVISRRIRNKEEFRGYDLATSPGQSLFLASLACILAAAATYISFKTPVLAEPARPARDLEKLEDLRFFPSRVGPEELAGSSTPSFSLRNTFGLARESMDDTASEREELYECEKCRKPRTAAAHVCAVEKRRRPQDAKEPPD